MQPRFISLIACTAMAIAVSGCARNSTPPMLSINAINCRATPDLGSALPVTLKDETEVVFDENTACLQPSGSAARLYAVFQLPESTDPLAISVKSVQRGRGIVAPYIVLLDENGKPTREMPHDRFMFRGSSLQLGIRPRQNERYLLVASDPNYVGLETSGIVGNVQQTMAGGPSAYFMVSTGQETLHRVTRAHGGTIIISAELLPKAENSTSNHPSMAPLH
jgi:hypothetical protein